MGSEPSHPELTGSKRLIHARVVTGSGGGPDKTILNSPRFLVDAGFSTLCLFFRDPEDPLFRELEQRAEIWKAPLSTIDDRGPLDWRVFTAARRLCTRVQPTIWHGHDYKTNFLGLALRRSSPMLLATTVHGWVKRTWKTPLYYAIDRWCLPRYDQVICVSRDLVDRCRERGVPEDRLSLVPNAIDLDEFSPSLSRAEAKARVGMASDRLVIGAVGRLSKEKAFDLLLQAFSRVCAQYDNLELWIIGEGDQAQHLENLTDRLQLRDRIRLLGFQGDVKSLYNAMDIFVLSSLREGLPNALLEAAAMELPIVCTDLDGPRDLIEDGDNGLVVRAGSVDDLTMGLESLISSHELRQQLGTQARKSVAAGHSFSDRMLAMRRIYERLLKSPAVPSAH